MGRKKQPYQKKSFESTGVSSDTSANIYMSMLLSPAWKELTAQQKTLYLYCKAQFYGEKRRGEFVKVWPSLKDQPLDMLFTMNKSKWCSLYGLYSDNNQGGFIRDMTALIEKGFVSCAACGAEGRKKTVYQYSSMWQKYGTDGFEVLPNDKTTAMLGCRKKKKQLLTETDADESQK